MAETTNFTLLFIGLGMIVTILLVIVIPNVLPTARGRLIRQRRELRHCQYQHLQAERAAARARRKFESLQRKAAQVKPLLLRESEETAKDLQIMVGHAKDKVLVAENHVRKIIMDEFPPAQQGKLLSRFVPEAGRKTLPFGF